MIKKFMTRFVKSESGAAMVEYAIALLVAAALGTGIFTVMGNNAEAVADQACGAMYTTDVTGMTTCP